MFSKTNAAAAKILTLAPHDMPRRDASRLLLSIVAPRPIAWVSTLSAEGKPNLAPFSFFNAVASNPPVVMISIGQRKGQSKDTLRNVQETGEFVLQLVNEALAEAMNLTSGEWEYGANEFELAKLETAPSWEVRPPRVAAAPVAMEARVSQIIPVEGAAATLVLGRIVRYHLREDLLRPNGLVDAAALQPIMRLGGEEYTTLGRVFEMARPQV